MNGTTIDINADLGESPEALANGAEAAIMGYISSANVACGGHAGDAETMRQTLSLAKELHVAVGAHPSYPDRKNFGRAEWQRPLHEIETSVAAQIALLWKVAEGLGTKLVHVKPHGALYHACNRDLETARAVGRAVLAIDPKLVMYGQARSPALDIWRGMGLRSAAEAFADRAYDADGSLRSRKLPGALLDAGPAAQQAVSLALKHVVMAGGRELRVEAETLCLHSDTPGAAEIARAVNLGLKSAGVRVSPVTR